MYKRIPIMLTADFSARTLEARREWQNILKVIEGKKSTNKITLFSKDIIQIQRRNQKLYRQAKVERIQYHQTSFTTNAKGTSLDTKHKRKKRPNKNKLKTINGNRLIHINNCLKYKSTRCSNQKTQNGWMDTKTRPAHFFPSTNFEFCLFFFL